MASRDFFTQYWDLSGRQYDISDYKDVKFNYVAGLPKCPKCKKDNSNEDYCHNCNYGEKLCETKKPTKSVHGYLYVVNKEYPKGRYLLQPSQDLFNSVIIEPYKKLQILQALSMVENKELIMDKWGFKDTFEKGFGTSFLFYGLPGTGKTLMAQAIADYLGIPLKTFTAADILDKYVGESEKKIKEVFDENQKSVILFDECDSLLYSRNNARASWQISQVNTLLNMLENHSGVSVFTTNNIGVLDEALDRRIALKLEFELPTKDLRIDIWKRMFPKKAPIAKNIDWELLADFPVAGGHIKNAVLRAIRITVHSGSKYITNETLKTALKQELESITTAQSFNEDTQEKEKITTQEVRR